ncbi:transcriptional regulator, MerR family [Clostridium sp. ATCC BAA-442]|uniref:MerR family transcriptional regulator n=1 Tax=Flavonifractor plautii TaxID=292800 RepID=UPI0003973489|nr:transcriptional regulator, MerR family [Clostridium sp. ATCC BAA-442]
MSPIKENLLSITELAKLRQVTSETLRYYDRIGLITPDYVDPQTRYRYYSIRQYEKLGTIKELRQLGMSIHDITDYFSGRNLRKSHQLLLHQLELLEEEIRKQQLLSEILRRKLHFLSEITPPPPVDKVLCRAFPQRYMITFGEPAGGSREHAFAFTRLERYLDEVAPILASDRIGVYADWHLLEPSDDYIPAVPMIFVERDAIESEHKRTIPPGDYLCMNYRRGELERYHPSFARLHTYMAEHGWVLNGMIFQFYKIDVTLTSDPDETLMEIQVPVRPAES